MRAALKGDQEVYRLLLTGLRLWLAAYFAKRVHFNAVEDLVQDTLLTLHAKRQTFDPHYSFGPWIAAIARHRWIDHMRATLKYVAALSGFEIRYDLLTPIPAHLTAFFELGHAADTFSELYSRSRRSVGFGASVIYKGLPLRFEVATGDEGPAVYLTAGYAW